MAGTWLFQSASWHQEAKQVCDLGLWCGASLHHTLFSPFSILVAFLVVFLTFTSSSGKYHPGGRPRQESGLSCRLERSPPLGSGLHTLFSTPLGSSSSSIFAKKKTEKDWAEVWMLTKTPNILTGGCTSPSEVAALRHLAISSFSSWNHPCSAPSNLTPCMSEALHANYMHDPAEGRCMELLNSISKQIWEHFCRNQSAPTNPSRSDALTTLGQAQRWNSTMEGNIFHPV